MAPTFAKGDSLSINLLAYTSSSPARWDVVTYQSPDGKTFLTHRVVGLPGETVAYDRSKILQINGVAVTITPTIFRVATEIQGDRIYVESFSGARHLIQMREGAPAVMEVAVEPFAGREHCTYSQAGFSCVVPSDHFFVMGDNRDSSRDSRYLGFVHEAKIGGRVENLPLLPAKP